MHKLRSRPYPADEAEILSERFAEISKGHPPELVLNVIEAIFISGLYRFSDGDWDAVREYLLGVLEGYRNVLPGPRPQ